MSSPLTWELPSATSSLSLAVAMGQEPACPPVVAWGCCSMPTPPTAPVSRRQTGVGLCSMSARVAGILAPLVRLLGQYHRAIPMAIFGSAPVLGGLLCVLLPETRGVDLADDTGDGHSPAEVGAWCCLRAGAVGRQRWGSPLVLRVLGVSLGVTAAGGHGVGLSHCGGRGGDPIILLMVVIPSFLSVG